MTPATSSPAEPAGSEIERDRPDLAAGVPHLRSAEWTTKIQVNAETEDGCCYHAEIYRSGDLLCRVSLSGAFVNEEAAVQALALRLRDWISEYEARDHMGSSAALPP